MLSHLRRAAGSASLLATARRALAAGAGSGEASGKWRMLREQGHDVNPCNSRCVLW